MASSRMTIHELRRKDVQMAREVEQLQMTVNEEEVGKGADYLMHRDTLLQIVDPELGKLGIVLVAKHGEKAVGYSILLRGTNDGESSLTTIDLGVHPSNRGEGIAKALQEKVREIALKEGIAIKLLTVSPHNIASIKPNTNLLGFSVIKWIKDYYAPGMHRFVVKGQFAEKKKPVEGMLREAKPVELNENAINAANGKNKPFLLPLIAHPGSAGNEAYQHVNWNKFQGTHVHEKDGKFFLLLEQKSRKR